MTVEAAMMSYWQTDHENVAGWLNKGDMALIGNISEVQRQSGVSGDLAELGVFQGKSLIFLSLLSRQPEKLFAFDIFPDDLLSKTKANLDSFANYPELGKVHFHQGSTTELSQDQLEKLFDTNLRILHIDAKTTQEHARMW